MRVDCPMDYPTRTTIVTITACWWEERRFDVTLESIMNGLVRTAIIVSQLAQMDILNISYSPELPSGLCAATIVYLNNGRTFDDIVRAVKPYENCKRANWTLLDVYYEFGYVNIIVSFMGKADREV